MMKTKKAKGRTFAKQSMAQIRRPVDWLRGFNALRNISIGDTDSDHNPRQNTGLNLNVMSFNIRRGTKKDGKNHWIYRCDRVCELLNQYRPDVLGLQEAVDFQISAISAMLPGYEKVGMGNFGGSRGLHTAIFYDAARFAPSAEGTFWFSDTPDIPASKGWGNIIPRTCTWVRLVEKDKGQAFYFYNVHMDHLSRRSQKNSVMLLTRFIHERLSPDPYVLTGDFNARERSAPIKYLKGNIPLRIRAKGSVSNPEPLLDTFRVRYPDLRHIATYHGFRKYFFRLKLDYIFVPPSARVKDAKIIQPQWDEFCPSDHFPLLSHIDLSVVSATANPDAVIEKASRR
ncbi:MAG: endonuclease/exonuclease/phosphatase family protein [Deltaproteobacteria bacterium]|nr:endonuclease/exonuclease/phosphatase family protein [Deltaproteobacteria bacterium]